MIPAFNLGLDIGANSIGWILLRDEISETEPNIIACGTRIFQAGTTEKKGTETSSCVGRREARGQRRQIERRGRRKRVLVKQLSNYRILSVNSEKEMENLIALDPYKLRAGALDAQVTLNELARIIIHINQRRGFKSNRRVAKDSDAGKVAQGISDVKRAMDEGGFRTLGEFLNSLPSHSQKKRGRYLARTQVRDEFDIIWKKQAEYYPEILTEDCYKAIADRIVFYQRPFDKDSHKLVGICTLECEERRERKGHRIAHYFRILSEVNNIRVSPANGEAVDQETGALTSKSRHILIEKLQSGSDVKTEQIHKWLGIDTSSKIDLGGAKRDKLTGNSTEKTLINAFGAHVWSSKTEDEKNAICADCLELEDDELIAKAENEWQLSESQIEILLKNPLKPEKHGMLSRKAMLRLIPELENGLSMKEAEKKIYGSEKDRRESFIPYPILPFPPGTIFTGKGLENARAKRLIFEEDTQPITNPVVKKALFEVRKLVNAIIKKYGLPKNIRVELARDTKGSIDERNERTKENARLRKENEIIREKIRETLKAHGDFREPTGGDILKYKLWQECKGISPFSGRPILESDLYTGNVQVEHIIPFSRSLDDSFANKTLCFMDENQDKGNQTPYERWGNSGEHYRLMIERVKAFQGRYTYQKVRRFEQREAPQIDNFIARKLSDTQYIAKQVHKYLACLYPSDAGKRVQVARGGTTAALRHLWGLNSILWELNDIPCEERTTEKNRDDHRHHAIDAAVIALTSPSMLQKFALRMKYKNEKIGFPLPWVNFRHDLKEAVAAINVSHAPNRRVRGQLHEETLYGKSPDKGRYTVRKPVASLTKNMVADICDPNVRKLIRGIVEEAGYDWESKSFDDKKFQQLMKEKADEIRFPMKKAGDEPAPIKRVKISVPAKRTISLTRSNGTEAVAFPGNNHHVEIFEWEENGKIVRDIISVSLYEAAERVRNGQPFIIGKHPKRDNAKFLMSLCKNDMVMLQFRGGAPELCRVQKTSVTEGGKFNKSDMSFRLSNISGTKDELSHRRVSSLAPDQFNATKVYVDVLGDVQLLKE